MTRKPTLTEAIIDIEENIELMVKYLKHEFSSPYLDPLIRHIEKKSSDITAGDDLVQHHMEYLEDLTDPPDVA